MSIFHQGVTTIKRQYGADARHALAPRAQDFLARMGEIPPSIIKGPIDLRLSKKSRLASLYEPGAICSIFYEKDNIPSDKVLTSDLKLFLDYYFRLVLSEPGLHEQIHAEEDEIGLEWEDLRQLRVHKRVERNRSLAAKVKKHFGLTCQACGFNFEAVYGAVGRNFIEAHHLTPVSELRGKRVALDPKTDFAVLCSNCHRMIHKSEIVSDVEMFRTSVLRRDAT